MTLLSIFDPYMAFNYPWPSIRSSFEPNWAEIIKSYKLYIVARLQAGEALIPDEAQGIIGESVFAMLHNFDLILDVPTQYLLSICLGLIKKVVELTFKGAEAQDNQAEADTTLRI